MTQHAAAAADQHALIGVHAEKKTSTHTTHPQAQWFPKAGLGLFIHWGLASVHGDMDLSWGMIANTAYDAAAQGKNKLPPEEYWKLVDRFKPDRWDPDRLLEAAAKAGMTYAVLTTMHHDGYTLWPSKHSELGVQHSLGGRDLVRPIVEACRKHGLKVGLYYSPPDWYFDRHHMSFNYRSDDQKRFPGRVHFDTRHQPVATIPPKSSEHIAQWRALWLARVEELLTQYGRVDLIWFDGGGHDNGIRDRVRELQPHIVINSRSCDGDFDCTECSLPSERFHGWFETPHCWQHSDLLVPSTNTNVDFWGYLRDERYKPTAWMLETLVRLRTWGGNLLINVGPRPDGSMPEVAMQRLGETAAWMAHSKSSVIGTEPGAYPERSNVPVTTRGADRVWYAHLLPGFQGSVQLQDSRTPMHVKLLRTGESLKFARQENRVTIDVAASLRTSLVDVVEITWAS